MQAFEVEDGMVVAQNTASTEVEVQTTSGNGYTMRIRPYRTQDNVIEGAVIEIKALSLPHDLGPRPYHCTSSIGVTLFAGSPDTLDDVLRRADRAMYQAKAAGRNCWLLLKA